VLDHWSREYAANPIRALHIWEGGWAIWGAVIAGLIVAAVISPRRGWNFTKPLDAGAPALVLAQAIGRIACIITGGAMGKPTTGPFGFAFTSPNAMLPQPGVYYAPMPVYELAVNLGIFALPWQLRKRSQPDGQLFLVYLTLYSVKPFFLAFASCYQIMAFGLTRSPIVAVFGMAISLALLARMPRKVSRRSYMA
jgi:phosphatidylglycerol:prolipoprotein diacylglycerol transferase